MSERFGVAGRSQGCWVREEESRHANRHVPAQSEAPFTFSRSLPVVECRTFSGATTACLGRQTDRQDFGGHTSYIAHHSIGYGRVPCIAAGHGHGLLELELQLEGRLACLPHLANLLLFVRFSSLSYAYIKITDTEPSDSGLQQNELGSLNFSSLVIPK